MASALPVVAVIFGGRSSEHSISCLSADSVMAAIDREKFQVLPVGITRDGRMFLQNSDPDPLFNNSGELPEVATTGQQVVLSTDPNIRGFVGLNGADVPAIAQKVAVVFSVMHGPFGEDGSIQGALEFVGIPYVGSGVFASAAAMDKVHMKRLFEGAGLPVGDYTYCLKSEWQRDSVKIKAEVTSLGYPVFVKPARAGSSIGITKVKAESDLDAAMDTAFEHDPKVIIEKSIEGIREIECGVLVDEFGQPQASVPAEIIVNGEHDFYDFAAKYLEDSATLQVPADLTDELTRRVQVAALEVFDAASCEGFARCDFFLTPAGDLLVNEVNTLPGFTAISMFPRMWLASGMTYPKIVERLIQDALRKGVGLR